MNLKLSIKNQSPADIASITEVTEKAFQTLEINNHTEQFIIDALRAAEALTISLIAEAEWNLAYCLFPIAISDGTCDWYGLGPVSVLPDYQRQGVGKALLEEGLSRLKDIHGKGCCLGGHPEYYKKFGFDNVSDLVYAGVPREVFFALSFDGNLPAGEVTFHEAFKATGGRDLRSAKRD